MLARDGRKDPVANGKGYFVGPTILDKVNPESRVAQEEIFGPVLSVIRVKDLKEAIDVVSQSEYGNAASVFHALRRRSAAVHAERYCRNGGNQRGRACARGVLSVFRMEKFLLRRPARAGQRWRKFLYGNQGGYVPLARLNLALGSSSIDHNIVTSFPFLLWLWRAQR